MPYPLTPANDLALVEVNSDEFGFGAEQGKVENGILVELPRALPYFGFHSFAFESSYASWDINDEILEHYKPLVGKRVYWTALSERGMVLKSDKTYALIKLTDIIASSEPGVEAVQVISGEFRA